MGKCSCSIGHTAVCSLGMHFRWTPLHAAAISRDLDASCVFLDRLCDIKFTEDELRCAFLGKTRRAQSVLHLAVEHTPNESGASVLRRLLYMMKHETTFSQDDWGDILGSSNVSGNGLLHAALRGSNIDVFRLVRMGCVFCGFN